MTAGAWRCRCWKYKRWWPMIIGNSGYLGLSVTRLGYFSLLDWAQVAQTIHLLKPLADSNIWIISSVNFVKIINSKQEMYSWPILIYISFNFKTLQTYLSKGQWLWLSWLSGGFGLQRSVDPYQSSAKFILNIYCQLYWKTKIKKRPGIGPFLKIFDKRCNLGN